MLFLALGAGPAQAAVVFGIDDTASLTSIVVDDLAPANAKGPRRSGTASAVLDGLPPLALTAKQKVNRKKARSSYRLKTAAKGFPKLRAKVVVTDVPEAVVKVRIVLKLARKEKVKQRDSGRVHIVAPATTTTTTGGGSTSTSTTVLGSTTTTSTTLYGSFADAPPAVLERLDQVLADATDLLNGGGTFDDVAAMLAGEADVTDVRVDGVTLYMTVAGLESGLHDGQAARLRDDTPATLTSATTGAARTGPVGGRAAAGLPPTGQRMLGADRDGDGQRDVEKKALVLAPHQYQFGANDFGPAVRDLLAGIPDYAGRVTSHQQTSLTSTIVPISRYTDWDQYDLIHVSTHGNTNILSLGAAASTCTAVAASMQADLPDAFDRMGTRCFVSNVAGQRRSSSTSTPAARRSRTIWSMPSSAPTASPSGGTNTSTRCTRRPPPCGSIATRASVASRPGARSCASAAVAHAWSRRARDSPRGRPSLPNSRLPMTGPTSACVRA